MMKAISLDFTESRNAEIMVILAAFRLYGILPIPNSRV